MQLKSDFQQCYAIVPAAGSSRRMGTSKLLLPWPTKEGRDGKLIGRVLEAWSNSCITTTVVIVRGDDSELAAACRQWPVDVVLPTAPPLDMKQSIVCGIRYIQEAYAPSEADQVLVAPADLPNLQSSIIDAVANAAKLDACTVARFGGSAGHPVAIPWSWSDRVFQLSDNEGLNALVDRSKKQYVDFEASSCADDVDTPEEYERALKSWKLSVRFGK